jgi:hypothetical protein
VDVGYSLICDKARLHEQSCCSRARGSRKKRNKKIKKTEGREGRLHLYGQPRWGSRGGYGYLNQIRSAEPKSVGDICGQVIYLTSLPCHAQRNTQLRSSVAVGQMDSCEDVFEFGIRVGKPEWIRSFALFRAHHIFVHIVRTIRRLNQTLVVPSLANRATLTAAWLRIV